MTVDTTLHALSGLSKNTTAEKKKILIVSDESYNPGIIGLVAGKLTEEYYRPSIVIAIGNGISKASARSVSGFNIVEFIRGASNLLLDVGGHPMAAGFTIETKNIPALVTALEQRIEKALDDALLIRSLAIDAMIPSRLISKSLYVALSKFAPFGLGNYEPVFATNNLTVMEIRKIGAKLNHLKMKIRDEKGTILNAVGFGIGHMSENFPVGSTVDVAYTLNENTWNGITSLQLKIRDMRPSCQ